MCFFYKIFNFYKYLAQGYSRPQIPAYKTKRKGESLKEVFVEAHSREITPFLLRFPTLFRTEPPFV
jgi:hypothetical protein|nr:MAG TPA: hypothetical protein [Bacteriophage sp.]